MADGEAKKGKPRKSKSLEHDPLNLPGYFHGDTVIQIFFNESYSNFP